MSDQRTQLIETLTKTADRLREARVPGDIALQMERLAAQVDQPCVIAVVGRVKAGKSTFVNTLLGEDLAKVGATETTATINYFTYGQPDADKPVRCHWRGGKVTEENREFLDGLQGNTEEVLRRADGIDYLEYRLLNPYLERATLVDTPGMAAVVDEHQDRSAEFLGLRSQMRERQEQETGRLGSEADAVIYLIGQVARTTDQAFLEEFGQVTGSKSKALNAVGVVAKIDLQPELMIRREEIARKIATQLQDSLNTVVPVSAGIQRALDTLMADDAAGLRKIMETLRRIPEARLSMLLDSPDLFREFEFDDVPVSLAEREELLGDMPWTVFSAIANLAANPELDVPAVVEQLTETAGFGPLKKILERRFLERSHLLRSYRILNDARRLLDRVRFESLPVLRQQDRSNKDRMARFLSFAREAPGDKQVKTELEDFLLLHSGLSGRTERVQAALTDLDRQLSRLFHVVEQDNADVEALHQIEDNPTLFSEAELEELRPLFGQYGMEAESRLPPNRVTTQYVEGRAQAWFLVSENARSALRRQIGESASARYGLILDALLEGMGEPVLVG